MNHMQCCYVSNTQFSGSKHPYNTAACGFVWIQHFLGLKNLQVSEHSPKTIDVDV